MRFSHHLLLLAISLSLSAFALPSLQNGGFEELNPKSGFPEKWNKGRYAAKNGTVTLDKDNKASGNCSVRLEKQDNQGWVGCNQTIFLPRPLDSSRKVKLSLQVCGMDLKNGQLVLTAGTRKNTQKQWMSMKYWSGTFEWTKWEGTATLNPGTECVVFSIRTNKTGILWADNATLTFADKAAEQPAQKTVQALKPVQKQLLLNNQFEQLNKQGTFANNWRINGYGAGKGTVSLDRENKASGSCSVRISKENDQGWIGCDQIIYLPAAMKTACQAVVRLKVCGQNLKNAQMVLTAGPRSNNQKQWLGLKNWNGTFEWQKWERTITLNPGTECIVFSIRNNRTGILWADDASLTIQTMVPAQAAAAVIPAYRQILSNGQFEKLDKQGTFAANWLLNGYGGGKGAITLDKEKKFSGSQSIRLSKKNAQGWLGCYQNIYLPQKLKKACKVKISLQVCSQDIKNGQLVLTAGTRQNRQKQWLGLKNWNGSFGWQKWEGTATLNAGTDCISLSIRANGPGTFWIDDAALSIEVPGQKTAAADISQEQLLLNPNFSGDIQIATHLPPNWKTKYFDGLEANGDVSIIREKKKYGILKLCWKNGARRFGAEASLKKTPAGAHRYEATALARTETDGKAFLMTEMFHKDGSFLEKASSQPISGSQWQQIHFTFETVPDTDSIRLYCLSGETGAVFFKDINLIYQGPAVRKSRLDLHAKALPVDWNAQWNQGSKEFTSLLGAPVPLSFHFKGKRQNLSNPELVIDLPDDLKIAEAFCMHPYSHQLETWKSETVVRSGRKYTRYHFRNLKAFQILQTSYTWRRVVVLMIVPVNPAQQEASFPVYWRLKDDNHSASENSFVFHLKKMPEGDLRPKNFHIYRWGHEDYLISNPEILMQSTVLQEKCGLNAAFRYAKKFQKHTDFLAGRKWQMIASHPDYLSSIFLKSGPIKELGSKIEYRVTATGPDKKRVCPDYFTDDPEFLKSFSKYFKQRNEDQSIQAGDLVMLDFEPWETMDWCFCLRSRKKFAARFKLDHIPEIPEIKKNYAAEWAQFRCENTAEIIRICRESLNRHFPGVYLADYDYVVDFNMKNYQSSFYSVAKNPLLNEKYFDYHMASYYHYIDKKAFDMIRLNARTLQKKYIPVCAIDGVGYLTQAEIMTPAQVRQMTLAAAANGCSDFCIYPGIHLDGTMFLAFHQAINEIAVLEKYFIHGKKDADDIKVEARPYKIQTIKMGNTTRNLYFPNWKNHLAVSAIPHDKERLISVFNYHPETMMFTDIKAELPAGSYEVLDPIAENNILSPENKAQWNAADLKQGVLLKIAPRDVRFLLIRPVSEKTVSGKKMIDNQKKLDREFQKMKNSYGNGNQFSPVQSGSLSIQLVDQNRDGSPEIEISGKKISLYVDYQKNGIIRGFQFNGRQFPIQSSEDRIWLPKAVRGNLDQTAMSIVKNSISDGVCTLVLKGKLTNPPLTVQKTFTLSEANPGSWQIDYEILNHSGKETTFSWWNRNLLKYSNAPVFLNERQGKMQPLAEKNGDPAYAWKKNPAGFSAANIKGMLSGTTSEIRWQNLTMKIQIDSKDFQNYYYWLSPNVNTQEWMFAPVTVQAGKSWKYSLKFNISGNL